MLVQDLWLSPVVYTAEQKSLVDRFEQLPFESKAGDFWKNTNGGEFSGVKEAIKEHYLKAQDYTCVYCKQRIVVEHLGVWDAEHIMPKDNSPQFMFEPRNLCISCKDCNISKSNKSVTSKALEKRKRFPDNPDDYLFCHPHFHKYDQHIRIVEVAGFYLPLTERGIALVEICGLLRFVLKYGGYELADNEVGPLVVKLGNKLMEAETEMERMYLKILIKQAVERSLSAAAFEGLRSFSD